jgi:hypothetical protein
MAFGFVSLLFDGAKKIIRAREMGEKREQRRQERRD